MTVQQVGLIGAAGAAVGAVVAGVSWFVAIYSTLNGKPLLSDFTHYATATALSTVSSLVYLFALRFNRACRNWNKGDPLPWKKQ